MSIPQEESQVLKYIQQKGWTYKESTSDQLQMACPLCHKPDKFYIHKEKGLWDCKVCGETGHFRQLQEKVGDRVAGVMSVQEHYATQQAAPPLPDVFAAHARLMQDEYRDVLDYLEDVRGFKMEVLEAMKIGAMTDHGKKWIVIPHFNRGNLVYVKYRSGPNTDKAFMSSPGREATLYNMDVLHKSPTELVLVEGELDTLALLSAGYDNVIGVPGANTKKTTWVAQMDLLKDTKIFLCYDTDKVGQRAAKEMALKIGLEKVYNINLPKFFKDDGKEGKDINEWFKAGHTLEEFQQLLAEAKPFDVDGVVNVGDALDELEEELSKGTTIEQGSLDTPWPTLNPKLGKLEYGDVVAIIAEGKVGKTTMAENWLDYYSKLGLNTFMYCQEMPPKRLVRKWVSHVTNTDDSPGRSQMTVETIRQAKAIARERAGDILFGFTRGARPDHVFETIRQVVRRYGVKVVAFDNLQLLVRSVEHSPQETSVLSKRFKEIAMELGILLLLIVQPNRVKDGEIVAARNAAGSSAIEKDVDAMIALHRNRVAKIKADDFQGFLDTDENFDPQLLVRVDLSRYAPGGVTTLYMDGARSTVREFTPLEFNNIPKAQFGPSVPTETVEA